MINIRDIRTHSAYQDYCNNWKHLSLTEKDAYRAQAMAIVEESKASTSREPNLRADEPCKPL